MSKFKSAAYYNQAGVYESYTTTFISSKKHFIRYPSLLSNINIMFLVLSSSSPIYTTGNWTLIGLKRSIYGNQKYLQIFYKYRTNEVAGSSEEITRVFDKGILICLRYYQYFLISTGQEGLKTLTTDSIFGDKNLIIACSHNNTTIACSTQQIITLKQTVASFGAALLDKPKSITLTTSKNAENILSFSIGLI